MKICFAGPADSSHIIKWCQWFNMQGHETHVISFTPGEIEGTEVHQIRINVDTAGKDIEKLKYLFTGKQFKRIIEKIHPDIINAHYATSYGTSLALSGVNGYILSVWGSDIYDFPKKSIFHKMLLMFSLKKAKVLLSTSQAMADEAAKYTNRNIIITPFGVDMELFNPKNRTRGDDNLFVVGTIKTLSDKYGIKYILEAVSKIKAQGLIPIRLRIAGNGPQEDEYHKLADSLGISDITTWLGYISQKQAAVEWANMDVAVIPSNQESFGVSAVEAQASGVPVIISNIPGLMEATKPNETSLVVNNSDPEGIANTIKALYEDPEKRKEMKEKCVEYVRDHFEINRCFSQVEDLFEMNRLRGE